MKLNRGHSIEFRFWSRVDKRGSEECWLWTGKLNQGGYAYLHAWGRQNVGAHRVSYVLNVGPIPEGLHIDHLCRVRHCVNPAHLEPVTMAENTRRGLLWEKCGGFQKSKTHCPQGHEYTSENTSLRKGKREGLYRRDCRTCHRAREERKRRAAGILPRNSVS